MNNSQQQVVNSFGFITSMNILEFSDDSELEECNRIISTTILSENGATVTEENLVFGCNALLKRIYIEIYFLRDYEKAKQDIVLVRNIVGDKITEDLDRFLSQLNSHVNIEILNEKIALANTEGNIKLLLPLVEKRCLELANVGKYKQSLEDLDFNIQSIEKRLQSENEEVTKLQTQLLNLYKQRMTLFVNIKLEMERLLVVGQELSTLSHDSSQESVHLYFTTTSLNDSRHKLNGGNMDLIREFENIFLKEEEKARLWDISQARTFQRNLLPLSTIVVEKCVREIRANLSRAEQLLDKTNPSYHFTEIKEAIENDIKKQKTEQINKYIIYFGLGLSLIFLILSSPRVGIIKIKPQ
ncbi:predicted protein [Naegleria gruberi]|uniref:Predicted protein n=1 Tax=Naegleria gruberi TaxID=5762 RepID=D2VQM1_NAEGR|nr:uncharacterized protein NAEGRDRAFT_71274 [Naegleria gruberi]EFC40895.1 predicted protein [Naegleria gruberi]|eukprot:XP_002673639.1 predicted protein [Naegleria gruberi strain NEG-M]